MRLQLTFSHAVFLLLALVGLAGTASAQPAKHASNLDGTIGGELAGYADSDHTFVVTPTIAATVENPVSGWGVQGSYLVDVISAASADIVSTASPNWTEVRHGGHLAADYKPGELGVGVDATISSEPDYLSVDAGASVTKDLLEKNLTVMLAYDYGHDIAGRTGTPFSVFSHVANRHGIKLGATVVIDAATIASFVGDVMIERGDQSKPYRYIPIFAPGVDVPKGAPPELVSRLRLSARPAEQLPLARERYALSAHLAHRFSASTLRLQERLYADTWGLAATTTDARWLADLGRRVELGPHLRVHGQTGVAFWQRAYVLGPSFTYPAFRTGDRELGPLLGLTAGFSLDVALGKKVKPRAWILGFDLNVTSTRFFDTLYLTRRISTVGGVSLEASL